MTQPPATLNDFEQLLAKAKSAGLLPIMINGEDGGTVHPLQNLQMDYAGAAQSYRTGTTRCRERTSIPPLC